MLYSHKNQYPATLPERIRLSNGYTRTNSSTYTNDELTDAGYVASGDPPSYNSSTQKVIWNGTAWEVVSLTTEEINAKVAQHWAEVRDNRDVKIKEIEWRVMRNLSQTRQGLDATDNIADLDAYIQALRDITTTTSDPTSVSWPSIP